MHQTFSDVLQMQHCEERAVQRGVISYPRYHGRISLFGQSKVIGRRAFADIHNHFSAGRKEREEEREGESKLGTVNFYPLIVWQKNKKKKQKKKRKEGGEKTNKKKEIGIRSFRYFPGKERYQRILHVPPPVMRRQSKRRGSEHRHRIKRTCNRKAYPYTRVSRSE